MWLCPGTLPYCMAGLELKSNYYCIGMLPCYCINLHYVRLPNKYLELNQTKAIVRVSALGSNTRYSLYTNAHPFYGAIIKL